MTKTLIFAHRGFSGKFIENSLAAFQAAVQLGVDGIELDVWVCRTGEVVVFHDRQLERMTNGIGKIYDQTFTELRKLKLPNGQMIPTLNECLVQISRKCLVNIELKGPNTAVAVAQIITNLVQDKNWHLHDFIVTSFNHPELQIFHSLMPDVPFGPLLDGLLLDTVGYAKNFNANYLSLDFEYVTPSLVQQVHQAGLKILVYTVNDLADIQLMQAWNVDGIISNFPTLF